MALSSFDMGVNTNILKSEIFSKANSSETELSSVSLYRVKQMTV